MIEIKSIIRAMYETWKEVAPPSFHFAIVMWTDGGSAMVSSDETEATEVSKMLTQAASMVANSQPSDYMFDHNGVAGNA